MILKDVMGNTNVKEEIVEGKSTFVVIIVITRNVTWIENNVVYMWRQKGPQELYSKAWVAWAEFLQQVLVLHLYPF